MKVNQPIFEEPNKTILENYVLSARLKSKKESTITGEMWQMVSFLRFIDNKDMHTVTKNDIETFYLHRRDTCQPSTVHDNIVTLKVFFKWLLPDNDLFDNVDHKTPKNTLPVEELILESDVMQLLSGCSKQRDRALISLLWDSAARISEILDMNLKNIEFNKYGGTIIVSGKTGMRRIPLIMSVPELRLWLNHHPDRDNPNAPVFITDRKYEGEFRRLHRHTAGNMLKGLAKKVNAKKNIYPHAFRHGRLTDLAKLGVNEMELRKFAGWETNSDMPATYLHLSGADVESKILSIHGIITEKDPKPQLEMMPKECPTCKVKNAFDAKFCVQCGQVLDAKAAIEMQEASEKTEQMAKTAMSPENMQAMLKEMMRTMIKEELHTE
ncbi:MAG: tyrosine-type recombinase/integrase [Methanococcoides sp.]|nr:tyrosine-type recombinase/integrase [Methanococcoides sp.]